MATQPTSDHQPITNNHFLPFLRLPDQPITNNHFLPFLRTTNQPAAEATATKPVWAVEEVVEEKAKKGRCCLERGEEGEVLACGAVLPAGVPAVLVVLGLLAVTAGGLLLVVAAVPRTEPSAWTKSLVAGALGVAAGLAMLCLGIIVCRMGSTKGVTFNRLGREGGEGGRSRTSSIYTLQDQATPSSTLDIASFTSTPSQGPWEAPEVGRRSWEASRDQARPWEAPEGGARVHFQRAASPVVTVTPATARRQSCPAPAFRARHRAEHALGATPLPWASTPPSSWEASHTYTSHLPPSPHHHRRSPDIDTDSCVSLVDSRLEVLEELAEVHSK